MTRAPPRCRRSRGSISATPDDLGRRLVVDRDVDVEDAVRLAGRRVRSTPSSTTSALSVVTSCGDGGGARCRWRARGRAGAVGEAGRGWSRCPRPARRCGSTGGPRGAGARAAGVEVPSLSLGEAELAAERQRGVLELGLRVAARTASTTRGLPSSSSRTYVSAVRVPPSAPACAGASVQATTRAARRARPWPAGSPGRRSAIRLERRRRTVPLRGVADVTFGHRRESGRILSVRRVGRACGAPA